MAAEIVAEREKQMSKTVIFVDVQGRDGILETELPNGFSIGELHEALNRLAVPFDDETTIFIDEAEHPVCGEHHESIPDIKNGIRIHVCRCRKIAVTVHFLEKSAEHSFAPGTRLRAVKEWAVAKFKLDPKDAAEHVLQVCNSSDRPASDTPLHRLVDGKHCKACFDLVPEKRVEG